MEIVQFIFERTGSYSLLPKKYPFERTLKAFWSANQGDAQDQRLRVFEPQASFVIA
jgi:hypothetical protein